MNYSEFSHITVNNPLSINMPLVISVIWLDQNQAKHVNLKIANNTSGALTIKK